MEKKIKLNNTDIQIIKCLHNDARMPVTAIAEGLNLPESTVRHRLNRMVSGGVIEFVAQTSPLNVGYPVWIMMEIEVETHLIRKVAQQLAALTEVYIVYTTTGAFDISAGATFRTNEAFVDFLAGPFAKIKGVRRVTTRAILEVYKRQFKFLPPADEE
ncbi:Lrp/AsnC family transcriptional regulator [Dechloromonas agitata]|uniref:Lrp/AsnC family transcriptional regulator n=1 Tax=Dechloromonas agitata TaxID=73030 RepID=UPI00237D45E1|nr:Lrp/AsnC family transcriptional regulator [Dechloromonas agitata]MDE1544072.1 Lrp/AsnC family transcriptional regulator [Dechloromonas agitata]